jgi:hypothetical protein
LYGFTVDSHFTALVQGRSVISRRSDQPIAAV